MQVLKADDARAVAAVCEALVPGCARVGAEVYVDALMARMSEEDRDRALRAFRSLAEVLGDGEAALRERQLTPELALARALACEAFYSDFVAPGAPGPGAWSEIGFAPPAAARLAKDWSYLGIRA